MSKVDYAKIREENIKKYGTATHHLAYFADIYSTRTHFIFEVLQNAEDALSRRPLSSLSGYLCFRLYHDRLEIYHNGKPFDENNIIGICGIGEGTKVGDYTQIGKFGIGFKSVYAYSFFPQIHSEDEHFKISRFVEPYEIEPINSKDTLIVLPFDRPDNRPEWAFRENVNADVAQYEISQAITKLNIRTLLFLRHTEKIEWILSNGEKGYLTKQTTYEDKQYHWRIVEVSDHRGRREQWCIFTRTICVNDGDKEQQAAVEVAFLLDQDGKVTQATDTELVISFPTEKKTELGFLIQAPFKATKSRDNIKSDDPANHQMIQIAAQLTADGLSILRDTNCLAVSSYNALPLDENDFPDGSFFRPVYDHIRETLKTQPLLPAYDGNFINANEAKLARGKELVDLFSPEQLGALFNKQQLVWLDSSITSDKFPKLHNYLLDLADGIQITSESLVPKLTADFLSAQPMTWLIKFIQYLEDGAKALKRIPFIRLQSGEQVALPENPKALPTAWFMPDETEGLDLSAFLLVHTELSTNETVRKFLEKEGIKEIDAVDMVVKSILPKYDEPPEFNYVDYLNDLYQIAKALTGSDEIKKKLEEQLKNFAWLACIKASGKVGDVVVWKQPSSDLFAKPDELELSFYESEASNIYFLHPLFENQFDSYPSFKKFLNEKCVRNLNAAAIVQKIILPKYKTANKSFDECEYHEDLKWILKALSVPDLKQTCWLPCVHASGNSSDQIVWKKPNINESDKDRYQQSCVFEFLLKMSTIYERNSDHEIWFAGLENVDAYFLHPAVENKLFEQLNVLVQPIKVLTKNFEASDSKTVTLSDKDRDHKRGLHGFQPNAEIIGLKENIALWNMDKCKILWNILLSAPRIISGETQSARNYQKLDAASKKLEYTEVGNLCRNHCWMPDKKGDWHEPSKLLLADLPDEFETSLASAREVAVKLGMKKPEIQRAADELSKGNPRKRDLLEFIANASEDELEKFEKIVPKTTPPQPAPSFKEGLNDFNRSQRGIIIPNNTDNQSYPIANPPRYQNKLSQSAEEGVKLHESTPQTIRFSPVRESPSNKSAREFLYQQYQGQCQITGNTFPKASVNANGEAENYFEVCPLLSYANAEYLNDAGNMLCVSADTSAKLKNARFEWLEELESIIEDFKNRATGEIENVKVTIQLASDECEITWSERHFARLVALWEADNLHEGAIK